MFANLIMSEKWRVLAALEASNGVRMFGLSAGAILAVMMNLFSRHSEFQLPEQDKTKG